jgi:hypothetical protein
MSFEAKWWNTQEQNIHSCERSLITTKRAHNERNSDSESETSQIQDKRKKKNIRSQRTLTALEKQFNS